MATYFHGSASEINSSSSPSPHADGLQTLYLMNPNFHAPYSDAPNHPTVPTPNMLLLNPNAATHHHPHALNLANLSHAPPLPSPNQHHHLANILGSANSDDHSRQSLFGPQEITAAFHGFSPASAAAAAPRVQYNLWGSVVDQAQQSSAAATPSSSSAGGGDVSPQIGFRRPSQQGLSLSLSSQQQQQQRTINYRSLSGEIVGNSPSSASNGISSVQSVILGSKYLKAAQELLDEVVNVGNNNKGIYKEELAEKVKANRDSNSGVGDGSSGGGGGGGGGGENSDAGKHVAELTTAQRQELQMKKSKLVSMLDEVEQRYRQYQQQMQMVITSFEQAAGMGAARSYTALALKTISKQFRCLKDAISSQIRATSKTLGEEDCLGVKFEGSRLRFVDHHLRQQRALQQLGMIQPNAWRPQRGLPERAVSILRAWLFEHFLHPYPKDSDKVMLAKQTGLTRSQVSNWFINARVRLWKPMVEEMYMEEVKDQEHNNNINNGSDTATIRSKESSKELGSTSNPNNNNPESGSDIKLDQIKIPQSKQEFFNNNNQNISTTSPTGGEISISISGNSSIMSTSPMGTSLQSHTGFHHLVGGSSSDKPIRASSEIMLNSPSSILSVDMEMKHHHQHHHPNHHKDGYPLMTGNTNHNNGGYGGFSMEDIGNSRFNVTDQLASRFQGNGVSLTLGLPHSNNADHQHGFLSQNIHNLGRRIEMGTNDNHNNNNSNSNGNEFCVINTAPPPHSSHHSGGGGASYESSIDIQNRKRFAAQLLPDFVA